MNYSGQQLNDLAIDRINQSAAFSTFCSAGNAAITATNSRGNNLLFIPQGRLGNQMFQYASAYGIAKHNNRTLVGLQKLEIWKYFSLQMMCISVSPNWPVLSDKHHAKFEEYIYNLDTRGFKQNITLSGFFQSWLYFKDVYPKIKEMFAFLPNIKSKIQAFYDKISIKITDTLIGIHVRRGDMKIKQYQIYGANPGEADFIERAMRYFIGRFKNVSFIICSDDIPWCKQNINLLIGGQKNVTVKAHFCDKADMPIVHMGILASCHHSIITGGTFGWWSAFLAGGETVYFKDFPRPNSRFEKINFSENKTDYYLSHWIKM